MADRGGSGSVEQVLRIDAAFRAGDLAALRSAADDPSDIPNGTLPLAIGNCLVYAIYHSPIAFIRELLELGADPRAEALDGFPPLIAALSCSNDAPGSPRRADTNDIIALLLDHGADPGQRGINDWTALHMAVVERNVAAARLLLNAGADPSQATRIDEYETALDMARAAGLRELTAILARH